MTREFYFPWQWDLRSSPEEIWPFAADTNRFNRDTGQPEIEMLDNYLALEQMRFKKKFAFTISTSPDMQPDEIYLSPMLVQPFVENAILHGMKNKTEGGQINIHFEKKNDVMLVSITDNGPGFSSNDHHETKDHKSFGMSLTKKRLHLLTNFGEGNSFASTNLTGSNGEVIGSRVSISIPLE